MFITGNPRLSVLVMIKLHVFYPLIDICIYNLHLVSLLGEYILLQSMTHYTPINKKCSTENVSYPFQVFPFMYC